MNEHEESAARPAVPRGRNVRPAKGVKALRGGKRASEGSAAKDTRQDLVDTTIRMIRTDGLGNTNSSEIARRIGASWGVIQYYFGTWEALLLEAMQQLSDANYAFIGQTKLAGDTVVDRLTAYAAMTDRIYSEGRYSIMAQIAIHLLAKPKTHTSTIATIEFLTRRQDAAMRTLLNQVSPVLANSTELRNLVLYSLAGMCFSLDASGALYSEITNPERHPDAGRQRELLVQALALLLERSAAPCAAQG